MKLVELIIDILEKSEIPLTQGEILSIAEKHEKYYECEELQKVQVPLSAVARCLTKYSSGSNPVFGIQNEGKAKKSKKHLLISLELMGYGVHSLPALVRKWKEKS